MRFEIQFTGHKNIRSRHQRTIEITKDSQLTPEGDCIVGINANCGCQDIPAELKKMLQDPSAIVEFTITVERCPPYMITGFGHPELTMTHPSDIVIRKSRYVCPRTLAVGCDKASDDLPRRLVTLLQDPKTKGVFSIQVK